MAANIVLTDDPTRQVIERLAAELDARAEALETGPLSEPPGGRRTNRTGSANVCPSGEEDR